MKVKSMFFWVQSTKVGKLVKAERWGISAADSGILGSSTLHPRSWTMPSTRSSKASSSMRPAKSAAASWTVWKLRPPPQGPWAMLLIDPERRRVYCKPARRIPFRTSFHRLWHASGWISILRWSSWFRAYTVFHGRPSSSATSNITCFRRTSDQIRIAWIWQQHWTVVVVMFILWHVDLVTWILYWFLNTTDQDPCNTSEHLRSTTYITVYNLQCQATMVSIILVSRGSKAEVCWRRSCPGSKIFAGFLNWGLKTICWFLGSDSVWFWNLTRK